LPQAPQFCGSLWTSGQLLPHFSWPAAQAKSQTPPAQVGLPPIGTGQLAPQPPQLEGEVATSTQAPPHATLPSPQLDAQLPLEQTSKRSQVAPQAPQSRGSLASSTHSPAQLANGG
jgi:hypothetical protein